MSASGCVPKMLSQFGFHRTDLVGQLDHDVTVAVVAAP